MTVVELKADLPNSSGWLHFTQVEAPSDIHRIPWLARFEGGFKIRHPAPGEEFGFVWTITDVQVAIIYADRPQWLYPSSNYLEVLLPNQLKQPDQRRQDIWTAVYQTTFNKMVADGQYGGIRLATEAAHVADAAVGAYDEKFNS